MKKLISNILSLLVISLLAFQVEAAAGGGDYTKVIHNDFSINAKGTVDLENRMGSIEVITWDKNQVDIEVTLRVEAKSEDQANQVFDEIDIKFQNSDDEVSAKTNIGQVNKKKSWWSWGAKEKINYSIDYIVKMPKTCNLDLEHSYGHVSVTNLYADAVIRLKYGDLIMGKISGDLNLELGYAEAKVNEAAEIDAEVWYSDLRITSLESMDIESRYSKISVDYAREIDSESQYDHYSIGQIDDFGSNGRYDDFEIERVKNIDVESRYSDYVLDYLSQNADMEMEYGEAKIKRLVKGFNRVRLEGRHVRFNIWPDKDASYILDIESDYTQVHYPKQILRSNVNKEGTQLRFEGIIGSHPDTKSEIKARTVYGMLVIE